MATLAEHEETLRQAALAYPGAFEEFPWAERVVKVNGKIFVFLGILERNLRVTVKLPASSGMALSLPGVEPTGYGLGKAGWVTARFARATSTPLPMLLEWLEESYRAVAPRARVKELEARRLAAAPKVGAARPPRAAGKEPTRRR